MKKRIAAVALAVLVVLLVIGGLGGIKAAQVGAMIEAGESFRPPPIAVTTAEVHSEEWEETFTAVGSLVAVHGVTLASEVPGSSGSDSSPVTPFRRMRCWSRWTPRRSAPSSRRPKPRRSSRSPT